MLTPEHITRLKEWASQEAMFVPGTATGVAKGQLAQSLLEVLAALEAANSRIAELESALRNRYCETREAYGYLCEPVGLES